MKTKFPQTLVTKLRADIDRHQRAVLSAQRSIHFHKTAIRVARQRIAAVLPDEPCLSDGLWDVLDAQKEERP